MLGCRATKTSKKMASVKSIEHLTTAEKKR